jgi:hypothetical protein
MWPCGRLLTTNVVQAQPLAQRLRAGAPLLPAPRHAPAAWRLLATPAWRCHRQKSSPFGWVAG